MMIRSLILPLLGVGTAILKQVPVVEGSVSPSEFGKWWKDSQKLLETLNDYQALWIKVHNCV